MKNLWNQKKLGRLGPLDQLVGRSRLIGNEARLCVWGGGNTSSKLDESDFRGNQRRVLRVKGSGSDLKAAEGRHFTPLDLAAVREARSRTAMTDAEMVKFLASCQTDPQAPRASIEALLHGFLEKPHIDHTHADAILAVTNQRDGRKLAASLFGGRLLWIPYVKPGFTLAKRVAEAAERNPGADGAILENHGLITWGETSRESYSRTIGFVSAAERFFEKRRRAKRASRGKKTAELFNAERRAFLLRFYPIIRRVLGRTKSVVLAGWHDAGILRYVNRGDAAKLSQIGPATPDHMLRTKGLPLFVAMPGGDPRRLRESALERQIESYAERHRRYYRRFRKSGMFMLDPYPRVILVPGVGLIAAGRTREDADIAAEIYAHSMRTQEDASLVSPYRSMSEHERFEMEYWDLELYKLSLEPAEKELARRVALVTGACGGIGRAICRKLLAAGAQVVVTDLDGAAAAKDAAALGREARAEGVLGVAMDVTREASVRRAVEEAVLRFGGIDIVVSNAGIAKIASIETLQLKDWEKSFAVNATGHFLVTREAIRFMRRQGTGGSFVFIATKNVLAPGRDFGAYSASKAAEAQLARIVAIENGDAKIRANMVNPDGVFEGSGLWNAEVRRDRAASYRIPVSRLEDFYRGRNLLKERVSPEDVAESVLFLAGPRSSKTTGCIITVDGGVREAFPR